MHYHGNNSQSSCVTMVTIVIKGQMCYRGNAGPCRWPRGRSLRCPPGNGRQGAPLSPNTGLHYPRTPAGTHTHARSGGIRLKQEIRLCV